MVFLDNIIYGEKSGYISTWNNLKEKAVIVDYIGHIEDQISPSVYYEKGKHNLYQTMPSVGGVNLTDSCQLRCNYCAFSSGGCNKVTLQYEDVKAYIDFLFRNAKIKELTCGVFPFVSISFAGGGEPTFQWDLLQKSVDYIRKKARDKKIKTRLSITTNGVLNDEQIRYLGENFDSIMVSYDGISTVQNENRQGVKGMSTSGYVEHTVETLLKQNAYVIIRTTVWPNQYHMLKDMRNNIFRKFANIKSWEINPVNYVGRAQYTAPMDNPTLEFYKHFIELKQTSPEDICCRISSAWFSKHNFFYVCGTAFGSYPWLNADGRIISCLDARDLSDVIGEIHGGHLQLNDFTDTITECHINSMRERCSQCIAFIHCGGGCPLKNNKARKMSKDETYYSFIECENKKQYWREIIKSAMKGKVLNDMQLKKIDNVNGLNIFKLYAKGEENGDL